MTDHDRYSDDYLRHFLEDTKTIALVGASPKPERPSYYVMEFLLRQGYEVTPVNPGLAGSTLLGRTVAASLAEVPGPVDMVDVFRATEAVPGIVEEAIAAGARRVWLQLGIRHDEAARRAEEAGLEVVMDRCPKIEYPRLFRR